MKFKFYLRTFGTISIRESWFELLHHTLLAATIACAMVLIENTEYLDWLDALSLRVTQISPSTKPQLKNNNEIPSVLIINDAMYENYFLQQSPLNREKLAQLLEKTIEKQPRMIVFDLDLSPGGSDVNKYATTQTILDNKLDSSAHFCKDKSSNICIILPIPLTVKTHEIQTMQFQWMKDRCHAGIEFSTAKLISHQSVNLFYFDKLPTIGSTAFNIANRHKNDGLCDYIKTHNNGEYKEYIKLLVEANKEDTRLINPKYFQAVSTPNSSFQQELSIQDTDINIQNKVVFIGGDYGKDDRFRTTRGIFSGIYLHAAGFYSYADPIKRSSHTMAVFIDIVLGIILGYLFVYLWQIYNTVQLKFIESKEFCKSVKLYLLMRFWLIVNLGLMLVFLWGAVKITGWMLEHQLWLNPGPIIIGMFLHGLLTSKQGRDKDESCKKYNNNVKTVLLREFVKEHPDVLWQTPVVVCVLFSLMSHH